MSAAPNFGKEYRVSGAHKNDERTKDLLRSHKKSPRGQKLKYVVKSENTWWYVVVPKWPLDVSHIT